MINNSENREHIASILAGAMDKSSLTAYVKNSFIEQMEKDDYVFECFLGEAEYHAQRLLDGN